MDKQHKMLGVIGGLGPGATAHFMELVIRMTDAKVDQEHLEMLIHNAPATPDRTQYILDPTKPNPFPKMLRIGKNLACQGAGCIAIPCVTAHYFHKDLEAGIPVPVINGVRETVLHLKEHGIQKVGIMATDGTVQAGIFHRELEAQGMVPVVPSPDRQADVMHLIFQNIKAGVPPRMELFHRVREELFALGAQGIILGCTELSLIKRDYPIGPGFVDAMEVLAQRSVILCGGKLKEEYRCLITH